MSNELDSLRRRLAGFNPGLRLSGPEELIVSNQAIIMRALLFLLGGDHSNGERGDLRNAIDVSLAALSDNAR